MGAGCSRLGRAKAHPTVQELPPPYDEKSGAVTERVVEKPRQQQQILSLTTISVRDSGMADSAAPTPAQTEAQASPTTPAPAATKSKPSGPWQCVPLIDTAHSGHREVAQALVVGGADIEARNMAGHTALYAAARGGHLNVLQLLHEKGASLDVSTKHEGTPMYSAARYGHLGVVEYLLAHGVSPDQAKGEKADRSPLAVAVRKGHIKVVKALLDAGASMKLDDGKTPLYHAARSNQPEIVRLLLEYGADPNETTMYVSHI